MRSVGLFLWLLLGAVDGGPELPSDGFEVGPKLPVAAPVAAAADVPATDAGPGAVDDAGQIAVEDSGVTELRADRDGGTTDAGGRRDAGRAAKRDAGALGSTLAPFPEPPPPNIVVPAEPRETYRGTRILAWLLLLAALLVFWALRQGRLGARPGLKSWLSCYGAWIELALLAALLALLLSPLAFRLGLVFWLVLAALAVPLLLLFGPDLLAGAILLGQNRWRVGLSVRVGRHEGRIVHFGVLALELERPDGRRLRLAHRALLGPGPVLIAEPARSTPVLLHLEVPAGAELQTLLRFAREAALASPYAHLGTIPEVCIEERPEGIQLRVEAYAITAEAAPLLGADVRAAWRDAQKSGRE